VVFIHSFGTFELADHYNKVTSDARFLGLAGGALTGAVTTNSTIDGRDVAADGVLATNAMPKSGGSFTGNIATKGITSVTLGNNNFVAGSTAGDSIVSGGDNNTLVGTNAGTAITTGDNNTAFGYLASRVITTGSNNVSVGAGGNLGANTTGANNVAVGYASLSGNTTASNNVAVGYDSLGANTTGTENVAVGASALTANTTNGYNTAVGFESLKANTTGNKNTAVGRKSLLSNTTGIENVAVGYDCLDANTTGLKITAVGKEALTDNTTANYNTAVGYRALQFSTTGGFNTGIGYEAGYSNTTGQYNTFLGMQCYGSGGTSNQNVIGYGVVSVGGSYTTLGIGASKSWLSTGATSWSGSSDERLKNNITSSTAGLSFINDLRPVTYEWKAKGDVPVELDSYEEGSTARVNGTDKVQHGFIAQEVKAAIDAHSDIGNGHGMWNELSDGTQGIAQGQLVPMLVKALQELSAKNDALETQNATFAARLTALEGE